MDGDISWTFESFQDGVFADCGILVDSIMDEQSPTPVAVTEYVGEWLKGDVLDGHKTLMDVDEVVLKIDEGEEDCRKSSGGMTVDNILDKELPTPAAVTGDVGEWQTLKQLLASLPEGKANHERLGIVPSDASQEPRARIGVEEQKRNKTQVVSWTEDEHKMFLLGLEIFETRKWKTISTWLLPSKSPTQIGSHAQKYFLRTEHKDERQRKSINDMMSLTEEDRQKLCAMLWKKFQAQQQQQPLLELSPPEQKIRAFIWKRLQAGQQQQQPLEPSGAAPTMQSHEAQFHQVPGVAFPGHERQHLLHQMPVTGAAASLTAPTPSPPTWNRMPNTSDADHAEEMQGMNINMTFAREEDKLKLPEAAPPMVHCSNASQVHRVPDFQERKRKEAASEEELKWKRTKVSSWTADEHKMFLYGLEIFERSWETISKYLLPHKTPVQIESHAQQFFNTEEWQRESDEGILREEDKEKARALIWRRLDAPQEQEQQQQQPLELARAAPTEARSHAARFHQIPGASFPGPRPPTCNRMQNRPIACKAEEKQSNITFVREEDKLKLPQQAPAMVQSQASQVCRGMSFPEQRQPDPRHHLHHAPVMVVTAPATPCSFYDQVPDATWNMVPKNSQCPSSGETLFRSIEKTCSPCSNSSFSELGSALTCTHSSFSELSSAGSTTKVEHRHHGKPPAFWTT